MRKRYGKIVLDNKIIGRKKKIRNPFLQTNKFHTRKIFYQRKVVKWFSISDVILLVPLFYSRRFVL